MSTDFQPVTARPDRRIWILIAAGIVCAIVLVWAGRRSAALPMPSMPAATSDSSRSPTNEARTKLAEAEPPAAPITAPTAVAPATAQIVAPTPAAPAAATPVPAVAAAAPAQVAPAATPVATPAPAAPHVAAADSAFTPGPLPKMQTNEAPAAVASPVAMVPRAELAKETARLRAAEKTAAADRAQIEDLTKQLADARSQLAAQLPTQPKSTDRDQILQVLAPVLSAGNGHP